MFPGSLPPSNFANSLLANLFIPPAYMTHGNTHFSLACSSVSVKSSRSVTIAFHCVKLSIRYPMICGPVSVLSTLNVSSSTNGRPEGKFHPFFSIECPSRVSSKTLTSTHQSLSRSIISCVGPRGNRETWNGRCSNPFIYWMDGRKRTVSTALEVFESTFGDTPDHLFPWTNGSEFPISLFIYHKKWLLN